MGASNVATVYACWGETLKDKHAPFRVLAYMALLALDRDNPPRYWAGRDHLAKAALGRDLPPDPSPEDDSDEANKARADLHAARTMVKAHVKVLVDVGALKVLKAGRVGTNTEYALQIQAHPAPAEQAHPAPDEQAHPAPAEQAHPAPAEQAHPAPAEQAHPAASACSPCSQPQGEHAPDEESGGPGVDGGGDRLKAVTSLARDSAAADDDQRCPDGRCDGEGWIVTATGEGRCGGQAWHRSHPTSWRRAVG